MFEKRQKDKGYVIFEDTIANLETRLQDLNRYDKTVLYEHVVDREDLSAEQKDIQTRNRWTTEKNTSIRIFDNELYDIVKEEMYAKLFGGVKADITKNLQKEIMDTKITVVAYMEDYGASQQYRRVCSSIYIGDKYKEEYIELSNDIKEFEEALKDVKYDASWNSKDGEYVYIERFVIDVYPYAFNDATERVGKMVKKFIRNELTYCLKNDKLIVPKEYMDKGQDGIKEWREIKASGNKNNSIEKRMLREIVAEKKIFAFKSMQQVMHTACNLNQTWSVPCLEIDGRWNKQRTSKLVNQVIDNKSNQYYIDMDEEKVLDKFKEYWKDKLMESYNEIDKLTVEQVKNAR